MNLYEIFQKRVTLASNTDRCRLLWRFSINCEYFVYKRKLSMRVNAPPRVEHDVPQPAVPLSVQKLPLKSLLGQSRSFFLKVTRTDRRLTCTCIAFVQSYISQLIGCSLLSAPPLVWLQLPGFLKN